MPDPTATVVDRIRKPEYTGENRCVPCTVVNVVIAMVASAIVAVATVELAVVVLGLSLVAIYLRGYLVPGTPALTERYMPERVLALFEKAPGEETDWEEWETIEKIEHHRENAVDPEQFLQEVDAVEPCEHEDDLCLTDEFEDRIERLIEPYDDGSVGREPLAAMFQVEPDEVSFEDRDYPAITIGRRIRKWPGEAALVADVATHEALAETTDRWADVPLEQRLDVLESLRAFHPTCPLCAGEIRLGEDTVESCCRSYEVLALGCLDCEEPLLEFDPTVTEDGKGMTA